MKKIIILSDGTGETASAVLRSCMVQYPRGLAETARHKNIRSIDQIKYVIELAKKENALILYTLVTENLNAFLKEECKKQKIKSLDLINPVFEALTDFLSDQKDPVKKAGIFRKVNKEYFKRVEAIEYTVKHDDGKIISQKELNEADFVLIGISRTSKTPLSMFLSHKGWKVANIPLVLDIPLPESVFKINQKKIVGLNIDLNTLYKIRKERIKRFGVNSKNYADLNYIEKEIEYAEKIFGKNKSWPIFNITNKALEETAFEIVRLIGSRMGYEYNTL